MEITIRKGTGADTERFIDFLTSVWETMEHKEWFCLDSPEEIRQRMEEGTMELWLAMEGERIAGAFDILHPGMEDINYGWKLDFSREQLARVVHMDMAAVHPNYRGMGLQRRLLETAEQELRGEAERYLLCTIHPENVFSLNNALKQGYRIRKTLSMYGSVRHILCKKLFKKIRKNC